LGDAIRAARVAANMSQAELAELLGIRQSSVSQWERGVTDPWVGYFLEMVRLLGPSLLEVGAVTAGNGHDRRGGRRPGRWKRGVRGWGACGGCR